MSKVDLMEMEENLNYESEQAEQADLRYKYEKQQKVDAIIAAIELLTENGYSVTMPIRKKT